MTPAKREEFFKRPAKAMPEPKSELEHTTPYELLVAVVLSAQATDKSVNLATARLYPVANTPGKIVKLGVEGIEMTGGGWSKGPHFRADALLADKSTLKAALNPRKK